MRDRKGGHEMWGIERKLKESWEVWGEGGGEKQIRAIKSKNLTGRKWTEKSTTNNE
jgi:hypothetical protein